MTRHRLLIPAVVLALAAVAVLIIGTAGAWPFLTLGFVMGMGHALEADHLAAVGTMLERGEGPGRMMRRGAYWGAGHTLSLFGVSILVLIGGLAVSHRTETVFELLVGLMIVALGARVLWKLRAQRVHVHVHEHDGTRHIHAHSHAGDPVSHRRSAHRHTHPERGNLATLGVGIMHGLAGSAALVVLTVAATPGIAQALAYSAVFGLGSMAGMSALTAVASFPLALVDRGASWMKTATSLAIGALAIWVGGEHAFTSAVTLGTWN